MDKSEKVRNFPTSRHPGRAVTSYTTVIMTTPPKHSNELLLEFPAEHVLLITFNRPKALNAMTYEMTVELEKVLDWFNEEPTLWCVVSSRKAGHIHTTIFFLQGCHSYRSWASVLRGSRPQIVCAPH